MRCGLDQPKKGCADGGNGYCEDDDGILVEEPIEVLRIVGSSIWQGVHQGKENVGVLLLKTHTIPWVWYEVLLGLCW